MLESAFRTSVHRHVPSRVHKQPMLAGMLGTAGTPDTYYDLARDLWVEYKCTKTDDFIPKVLSSAFLPNELQRHWLNRRYANSGNCCVIVGFKLRGRAHGVVLNDPHQWSTPSTREWLQSNMRTAAELGAYITERVE